MAKTKSSLVSVPEAEQPHKIPRNWRWVHISAAADLYTGNSINEKVKKQKYEGNPEGYLYLATKDIGFDGVIDYETNVRIPPEDSFKVAPPGTALLCIEGGSAGRKIGFVNQAVCFVNKLCAFRTSNVHAKYVYYFLRTQCFEHQFLAKKHGLIGGVPLRELALSVIPVAPFAEQRRIVERIDSLFAKLDEARDKAQAVLDGYEYRRAAILHKAFTGALTATWRAEHGVSLESWKTVRLSDVCTVNPPKTAVKNLPDTLSVSFIPMSAVSAETGSVIDCQTRPLKEVRNGFPNFSEGDILFAKITPCMENGKSALVEKLVNGIGYGSTEFYVIRCGEGLSNRLLFHLVRSAKFRREAKAVMTGSVGQMRTPRKFIEQYEILLPPKTEQEQIVPLLDTLFDKEQQTKAAAEAVLTRVDLMKKAILGRAFRGELGTHDPTEASPNFTVD